MVFAESEGSAKINEQASVEAEKQAEAEAKKQARIAAVYEGVFFTIGHLLPSEICRAIAIRDFEDNEGEVSNT